MPKLLERCVAEVKARADVLEVVQEVVQLKRSGASWTGLCPFHEEKTPSFHVRPGKGWKCFGCGKGGDALKFVMEREGLEFVPAVEKLGGRFGILLEYEAPQRSVVSDQRSVEDGKAEPAENVIVLPDGVDPKSARRAIARQRRYEANLAKQQRLHETWLAAHRPAVERRQLWPWSRVVRERWEDEGQRTDDRGQMAEHWAEKLAEERGWLIEWVWWLVDAGLVAWPRLPWSSGQRGVAFRVDGPRLVSVPDAARTNGARVELGEVVPVGYHQRFYVKGDKRWLYVPHWPNAEQELGEFRTAMQRVEMARRGNMDDGLVPALPFFMGGGSGLRFLVVAEGQWDAVTFAGAMGWLASDMAWPEGAAVMGSRGSSGVDTLLAYWGEWIRDWAPEVLVLADNDKAGLRWDVPEPTEPGGLPMPTFAQKLEAAGARKVVISRVRADFGKDFNDYWRARRPSVAAMEAWLHGLGLRQ